MPKEYLHLRTIANNIVKTREAAQLNEYLKTLTYWERVEFVSTIVKRLKIKRQTFYNWKGMCCRIPSQAKEAIESLAGQTIFEKPT